MDMSGSESFNWLLSVMLLVAWSLSVQCDSQTTQRYDHSSTEKRYRAPKTCPNRPSYCEKGLEPPWACDNLSDCFRNNLTIQPGSKLSAPSANLSASVYYYNMNNTNCFHALNLTWTMNPNDTIGFLFVGTRRTPSKGISASLEMRLWIDKKRLTPEMETQNEMVTFSIDCIRLSIVTQFQFEMYSLHTTPDPEVIVSKSIGVTSLVTDCDTYPDSDPDLGFWDCFTDVKLSNRNSTATVYFAPAPRSFGFHSYDISILNNNSNIILASVYNLTFTCTDYDAVVFRNLCSGSYTIKIAANGGQTPCKACLKNKRYKNFNVIGSKYSCPSKIIAEFPAIEIDAQATIDQIFDATTFHEATVLYSKPKIENYLVIPATIFIIVITIIGILVILKLSKKCKSRVEAVAAVATSQTEPGDGVAVERLLKKQSVLIIYAKDNAYHCKVVQCFAAYLQQRCYCEVMLDYWCPDEISRISALDWLLLQIQVVENIIFINSEGGWRQIEGETRNIALRPIRNETPIEDMFLPAVKYLRNKYYYQPRSHKLFKVAFPYTHPRYFINEIQPGRSYQLMDHIEELFLNIHSLSKHSVNGRTTAVGINVLEYASCSEGRFLQAAINRAFQYFQANPDWFSAHYRQEMEPEVPPTLSPFERRLSSLPETLLCSVFDSGVGNSIKQTSIGSGIFETVFVAPSLKVTDGIDDGEGGDDDGSGDVDSDSLVLKSIAMYNQEYDRSLVCS